ncbi:PREDICTED: uncharacterized protein LOC105579397 [Cercocebus atys]|uniref:uncharacterized protein LOC105579397 n=1 Tax=Cercocebus atys TaxID=9531 RepID=UPI0005F40620|nr:PREDICTED: uncharacterized protein LOC105579397 [Cercocebus atys]
MERKLANDTKDSWRMTQFPMRYYADALRADQVRPPGRLLRRTGHAERHRQQGQGGRPEGHPCPRPGGRGPASLPGHVRAGRLQGTRRGGDSPRLRRPPARLPCPEAPQAWVPGQLNRSAASRKVKGWKLHLVQPSALMQKQLLPLAAGQQCDYSHRESCCPSPHRAESAGDSGADNGLQRGAERSLCSTLDPPPRRPPAGRRGRDKSSSACSGARARVRPPGCLSTTASRDKENQACVELRIKWEVAVNQDHATALQPG